MKFFVKSNLLILLSMLLTGSLSAQPEKISWGKVSKKELAMQACDFDQEASAMVLFDVAELKFDHARAETKRIFERHKRVKLFKRAGFEYADIEIILPKSEKMSNFKAQIFSPDGSKHTLRNADFFEEDLDDEWRSTRFTFPAVEEGAVFEFKYTLTSESFTQLPRWYFQTDIPVRWSEYYLEIPEWFNYVFLRQGDKFDVEEYNTRFERVSVNVTRSEAMQSDFVDVSVNVVQSRYAMENVPALKAEPYMTTPNNHRMGVQFQLSSIKWPNSSIIPVLVSWEDVAFRLHNNDKFGGQYERKLSYNNAWKAISSYVESADTDLKKAEIIYLFVSTSMATDGHEGILVRKNINRCFKEQQGSASEINLLLLGLLKEAGIEAYPVLSSTRDYGKSVESYPIVSQFNHVMVAALLNGSLTIMDAGNPFRPMGFPRVKALNYRAWMAHPTNPRWLPVSPPGSNSTTMFRGKLHKEGTLSGSFKGRYDGYNAIEHRTKLRGNESEVYWQQHFSESGLAIQFDSVRTENEGSITETLSMDSHCTLTDVARTSGSLMYLNPIFIKFFEESPFTLEERSFPVEIPYPLKTQFIFQVELPEGTEIDELPEGVNLMLEGGGMALRYSVSIGGNILSINYIVEVTRLQFLPSEYGAIKEFFNILLSKQAEQIVLRIL